MNAVGLIIYPVGDLAKATKFFGTWLGVEPYADSPYYVGFRTGEMEIGLVPQAAQPGITTPLAYATVTDIKSALATLLAAGAEKVKDITDVANGLLVASVQTPDGTPIGLRQFPTA